MEKLEPLKGAFVGSLIRTNKDIKNDRATAIAEDAEMTYKRSIEDMEMELKKLKRERENMLDLSPSNKMMIIQAGEFDSARFTREDQILGKNIRILKIKIEDAKERYEYLFGEDKGGVSTTPTSGDAVLMSE